jgi:hypothetical protein
MIAVTERLVWKVLRKDSSFHVAAILLWTVNFINLTALCYAQCAPAVETIVRVYLTVAKTHLNPESWPHLRSNGYLARFMCCGVIWIAWKCCDVLFISFIPFLDIITSNKYNCSSEHMYVFLMITGLFLWFYYLNGTLACELFSLIAVTFSGCVCSCNVNMCDHITRFASLHQASRIILHILTELIIAWSENGTEFWTTSLSHLLFHADSTRTFCRLVHIIWTFCCVLIISLKLNM